MSDVERGSVLWDDAHGSLDEYDADAWVREKHRPSQYETTGWILADDAIGVSIAGEYAADEDMYRGITFVPRGMVREVKRRKKRGPKRTPSLISSTSSTPSD